MPQVSRSQSTLVSYHVVVTMNDIPNNMDDSFAVAEYNCEAHTRISGGSSEEGFATAMTLRKNLTLTFDEQVAKPSLASTVRNSSTTTTQTSSSVYNRIAQFEAATHAAKPPLPLRQQSNVVPSDRLAIFLRIRPPTHTTDNRTYPTSTIEVLKPKHPNIHPTSVRTYPPADSNASKSHRETAATSSHAKQFDFSQVLEPQTTQTTVYSMVASPLLQGLFDKALNPLEKPQEAQSALLFSYGITNAGKTHTILGDLKSKNDAKWGIIPRAISDIFDRIQKLPKVSGHVDLYMSFFEVYNEQVFDLVPKKSANKNVAAFPPALKVRERHGQTVVRGLAKHQVRDIQHGIDLTVAANSRRHTSSNNLNSDSSRSHCICQMQLVPRSSSLLTAANKAKSGKNNDDSSVVSMGGYSTDEEASAQSKTSTIWIVDLAGSERSKRTGTVGVARQKEASQINKSLMTLMRCLTVMRESTRHTANVVPFRESKLSHVFMGHLTGPCAGRTAIIVNVNPSVADFDETQHVLAYASHAKLIQIDPQELQQKRKQYFGAEEYRMDGHKKKNNNNKVEKTMPTRSTLARMAKKLSPKKILNRLSPKKAKKRPNPSEKRKHDPAEAGPAKRPPLAKQPSESTRLSVSNHSPAEPATKRQRAGTIEDGAAVEDVPNDVNNNDLRAANDALAQAQAEIQGLQTEKQELLQELASQESQIRIEVSEEMEERLRVARERNAQELERLRALVKNHKYPLQSTRQAQLDHAGQTIDTLLDKVDECEAEMERLREQHRINIEKLQQEHQAVLAEVKETMPTSQPSSTERISELEQELQASRQQVERLKKSKLELVDNYEKLLEQARKQDRPEDSNEEAEAEEREEDEEKSSVPLWKQQLLKKRKVLGNMSNKKPRNNGDTDSKKGGAWIFPKATVPQDENGNYHRPTGNAPNGREWDSSVGAWKQIGLA